MTDTIDGFLSGKARRAWPRAQVWIIDGVYLLRRPDEPDVRLGTGSAQANGFGDAQRALSYLIEDNAGD